MTELVEGFPVLHAGSPLLHPWDIVGADRTITARNGSCGLALAYVALCFHDLVEPLDQPGERTHGGVDDGGHVDRPITGGTTPSKHATGCAEDLNWRRHPYNTRPSETLTPKQIRQIERILDRCRDPKTRLRIIEWGGHWPSHPGSKAKPDPMHFQISSQVRMEHVERWARHALGWPRVRRLLAANPGQRAAILS